jgi:hypothetical protein
MPLYRKKGNAYIVQEIEEERSSGCLIPGVVVLIFLVILTGFLVSRTCNDVSSPAPSSPVPTSEPVPAPTPITIPSTFSAIQGPTIVEKNLPGKAQSVIPLDLDETDIVKFELVAVGVYQVPFRVTVIGPENQALGTKTGTVINPIAFQATSKGRFSLVVQNTSGDFRGYRLTYTVYSGK